MSRKFETLEELEAFLLEKGAGGVTEVLVSEFKKKDTEISNLNETIDTLTLQMLEGGLA